MNSKLTILPHITVLSFLNLQENLNLRLINNSENKFFLDKYEYFKNIKQKLKLTLDSNSKSIKYLRQSQFLKNQDQVNVIGIKSNESLICLLEVLETLVDIHNPNQADEMINKNHLDQIIEEQKKDAQSSLNQEQPNLDYKIIKIHLSFTDMNLNQEIENETLIIQQHKLQKELDQSFDGPLKVKISQLLKKYLLSQQIVKFEIIFNVTSSLMMSQYILRVAELVQNMKISRTRLVINKNTSVVELRDLFQFVNELKISATNQFIFMGNQQLLNFGHIKRMNLQYNGIYPFPPMFNDLENLVIVDQVQLAYFNKLEQITVKYQQKNKICQSSQLTAFPSLKSFTGTFSIGMDFYLQSEKVLIFISRILESIDNASTINLKFFLQVGPLTRESVKEVSQLYCQYIEFIDFQIEVDIHKKIQAYHENTIRQNMIKMTI